MTNDRKPGSRLVRSEVRTPFNDQAGREWLAWRQLCKQLNKLGLKLDANAKETVPLVAAIKLWGEELHQLRLEDPQHDANALEEARGEYERHVLDGGAP